MAKEARSTSTADIHRACSNRRSRKNKCSSNKESRIRTKDRPLRKNPYVMKVNRRINCYACGGFGYIV